MSNITGDLTNYISVQWQRAVNSLKTKAGEFNGLYDQLLSLRYVAEQSPDLLPTYNKLMRNGARLKSTIQSTTQSIDSIYDTLRGAVGLGSLGLLPLVPVAVIAGSISALGIWITDAYVALKQLDERKVLINQGFTPTQITSIATGQNKKAWYEFPFSNVVLPIVGLVGGVLLLKKLRSKRT